MDRINRKFTTIEGNSGGGKVTSHTYYISDYYFGVPPYEDNSGHNPQGCVDDITGGLGGVYIGGWAFDYDMPNDSVEIHVYIGTEGHGGIMANIYREDVNNAYSIGGNHGFSTFINTSLTGQQSVSVYAINLGGGENVLIDQRTVTIIQPLGDISVSTDYLTYPAKTAVTVKWNSVTNATNYRVDGYCRFNNGTICQFIDENVGNQTSKEMTLNDAGAYEIYVYAYSGDNWTRSSCTFTVLASSSTPEEYKTCVLDGHTYTVYLSSKSWREAEAWCEEQDGHLATITEGSEGRALMFLTEAFSEPHFYIGGIKENGAWKWVTDEAFSYTNWGTGQPDYDSETKMAFWNHGGSWNNVITSEPSVYGFIFEKDPDAFSSKEKDVKPAVSTTAYILNEGEVSVSDDTTLGTAPSDNISANRISGLKFSLSNCSGSIKYSAHVSHVGWQDEVKDGTLAGVSDYSEGIEAIKISLSGDVASKYSVYYHTFVFGHGWTPWAKDGEISGSINGGRPITAIRVMLVPKATYRVHVSNQGWTAYSLQGDTAGTTGQELSLEAICIDLCDHAYGDVKYKTHMAYIGWGHSRYNGGRSGTTGLALQAEAFRAELYGTAASKFDIIYRAHVADLGWLDWQRNWNIAGTTGEERQMEAIQVMIVPKNYQITDAPTYITYDGSTKRTVFFNANGGTCSTQSKEVTYGSTYGTLPVPTKADKAFVGWFTDTNVPVTSTTMCGISGNMTVYAHWATKTPVVNPASGSGTVVDTTAHFIYGLTAGGTADGFEQNYVTVSGGSFEYEYPTEKQVMGTGTKVKVYDIEQQLVDTYTVVIFGDVDGDSWYDGTDAYFVRLVASGMVSANLLTDAQRMACDANHDGAIDAADVALIEQAGLLLAQVDQTVPMEELQNNSVYLEYCNLIDQNIEITEPDQPTPAEEPAPIDEQESQPATQTVWGWLKMLFTVILNWLLRVF